MSENNPAANVAESAAQRILEGQCWDEFCDGLKALGREFVLADTAPASLLDRAEGWRYLARLTRAGLRSFLEPVPAEQPEFVQPVGPTIKMGMDNPDNVYLSCRVSGQYDYRIRGKRNTVHFLGFGSQAGGYGKTGSLDTTGSLDASDLALDEEGCFEIIASCHPKPGNWLPMRADTNMIQARQSYGDRRREQLPELSIELIGEPAEPVPFNPLLIDKGLQGTLAFVRGTAGLFTSWSEDFRQHVNTLPRFDPEVAYAAGGDPKIAYYHSFFQLEDDEVLVVDLEPPRCEYWNFQLANYWLESLDYRNYQIHLNQHTAKYENDGSVQVYVAKRDPGRPNWLNTTGHNIGTMCVRWLGAEDHPTPKTRVIKREDLGRE